MIMEKNILLVIVGPTAVGKTEIALDVAKKLDAEIISADSMQVYKYMDIGTAKPSAKEQSEVKHHLIDIIEPDEKFSVADYQEIAKLKIANIHSREKLPILTGGTGLYINAVCYNYTFSDFERDPELIRELHCLAEKHGNEYLHKKLLELDEVSAEKIHPNNLRRLIRALEVCIKTGKPFSYFEEKTKKQEVPYNLIMFGLTRPRDELYERINTRVKLMIKSGLITEVEKLLEMGYSKELNSMQGLGYKQIVEYLEGKMTLTETIDKISRDTRRYAKRQYTWFLRDKNIRWFDVSKQGKKRTIENIIKIVEGKLKTT